MSVFVPRETVNRAGQVGERLEEAAAFERHAGENRRKAHDVGVVDGAGSLNQLVDAQQRVFERGAAAIHAGHTGGDEQALLDEGIPKSSAVDVLCRFGARQHRQSSLCTSSIAALAPSTRSLLIMRAAP